MENAGVSLTFEEVLRICMKYDTENTGKVNYYELLKHHALAKTTASEFTKLRPIHESNLPSLNLLKISQVRIYSILHIMEMLIMKYKDSGRIAKHIEAKMENHICKFEEVR